MNSSLRPYAQPSSVRHHSATTPPYNGKARPSRRQIELDEASQGQNPREEPRSAPEGSIAMLHRATLGSREQRYQLLCSKLVPHSLRAGPSDKQTEQDKASKGRNTLKEACIPATATPRGTLYAATAVTREQRYLDPIPEEQGDSKHLPHSQLLKIDEIARAPNAAQGGRVQVLMRLGHSGARTRTSSHCTSSPYIDPVRIKGITASMIATLSAGGPAADALKYILKERDIVPLAGENKSDVNYRMLNRCDWFPD